MKKVKEQLVKHELGHWITARHFGFDVGEITINIGCTGNRSFQPKGETKIYPKTEFSDIASIRSYVESRIIILMGGVASEFYPNKRKDDVERAFLSTANTDDIKIKELLYIARGIRFESETHKNIDDEKFNIIYRECWEIASEIIKNNIDSINKIARLIDKEVILTNQRYVFDKDMLKKFLTL